MTDLLCVRCSAALVPLELDGQSVSACPTGHGVWLGNSQLDALVEDDLDEATPAAEATAWTASNAHPREMETERFRTCPVCKETLRKDNWKYGSGVVVDTCDEHGIWVDEGEIERIDTWTEAWHDHAG